MINVITDLEGIIEYTNNAFTKITGYSYQEVRGKNPRILKSGEHDEAFYSDLWSKLTSGKEWTGEFHNKKKNGELYWESANIFPIFDEQNRITNYIKNSADISEQKKLLNNIEESEKKLREILETTTEGVLAAELKTRNFVYANPEICKMFGYTKEEMLSKNVKDLHPAESLDLVIDKFEAQAKGKMKLAPHLPCLKKDGNIFYANISTAKGVLDGVECNIGFFSDITELEKAQKKIKKLLEEKDILLHEVHHRIKNNMASIESLFRIQSRNTKKEEVKTAFLDAISRLRGMRVLYDKLYRTDHFRETSIADYLSDLVKEIIVLFPNSETVEIEENIEDFKIPANYNFPFCIIMNELLSNIMKYAFPDAVSDPRITVSTKVKNGKANIILQDNGIGLPDGFNLEKSEGFGLKLIQMLCEQIYAKLEYESKNGTKWIITLDIDK